MPSERHRDTRRRLGLALRKDRETAGLTQKQAADRLYLSLSTIIRIESGATQVDHVVFNAMVSLYGMSDPNDPTKIERLTEWVDIAQRPSPWTQYRDIHSDEDLILFESEAAATTMYKFESQLVPGLLQSEPYSRNLLQSLKLTDIDRRVECRRARQELLQHPPDQRPELRFIMGEAVISRAVGGREVMVEQVRHLEALAQQPGISLQIVPFSAGSQRRMGSAFSVLQFDEGTTELLYLENPEGEVIERNDPARISSYIQDFFELEQMACRPEEFADVAQRILDERFDGRGGATSGS